MKLEPGTQIIYVPTHAAGDIEHCDCERGFVTSVQGRTAFCRFWNPDLKSLRTQGNSEPCDITTLVVSGSVPRSQIVYQMTQIEAERQLPEVMEMERLVRAKFGGKIDEETRRDFFAGRDPTEKAKLFGLQYSRKGPIE
jgi:hypothetical protein